jgi:hypothetical protein
MKLTSCCNDDDDVRLVTVVEVGVVVAVMTFDLPLLELERGDCGAAFLSLPNADRAVVSDPEKSRATSNNNRCIGRENAFF